MAYQKFAGIGHLGWTMTRLYRVTHITKFQNMDKSHSKNYFCLRAGNVFPAPACKTNRKMGWVCEITAVNCLNKDSCTEVCSGNSSSCCLFTRDCPGQVLILSAYVFLKGCLQSEILLISFGLTETAADR